MVGHVCWTAEQAVQYLLPSYCTVCGGEKYKTTYHTNQSSKGETPFVAPPNEMLWPVSEVQNMVLNLARQYRCEQLIRERLESDLLKGKIQSSLLHSLISSLISTTVEVLVDCFCSTTTNAALHHRRCRPSSTVTETDKDQFAGYVLQFIPNEYRCCSCFCSVNTEIIWATKKIRTSAGWPGAKL